MLFLALPAVSAAAQDQSFEAVVVSYETETGVGATGAALAEGTFEFFVDGTVVETGRMHARYFIGETKVRGNRVYEDASTGNIVVTAVKALLIDADFDNGILTFKVVENIVSSTDGATGRGVGTTIARLQEDGSFTLESSVTFDITL